MSSRSPDGRALQEPRLRFRNVCCGFASSDANNTINVIENMSLDIADGEIVCIIAPSGAGKTTLLNIAAGFLNVDSGSVEAGGHIVTKPSPERCMVFQQYAVFPWLTVRKNIEFGLTLRADKISKAERRHISDHYIRLMDLDGFGNAYPNTLSGGMQQRVAIARAYAVSPEILLMDEPFGALDAQTRNTMQEQILKVMSEENRTIMFVTHSVEEAIYLGNRVIVLTRRPATIRCDIPIPFDHPRDPEIKTSAAFNEIRRDIEEMLIVNP
jgi:NitT/TauT family transport system ATP-binding protein